MNSSKNSFLFFKKVGLINDSIMALTTTFVVSAQNVRPEQCQDLVQQLLDFATTQHAWTLLPQLLLPEFQQPQTDSSNVTMTLQMYASNAIYDKVRKEWQTLNASQKKQVQNDLWRALEGLCAGSSMGETESETKSIGVIRRISQAIAASCVQSAPLQFAQLPQESLQPVLQVLQPQSDATLETQYNAIRHLNEMAAKQTSTSLDPVDSNLFSTLVKIANHIGPLFSGLWGTTPSSPLQIPHGPPSSYDIVTLLRNLGLASHADVGVGVYWENLQAGSTEFPLKSMLLLYSCLHILKTIPEEARSVDIPRFNRDSMQHTLQVALPFVYSLVTGLVSKADSICSVVSLIHLQTKLQLIVLPTMGAQISLTNGACPTIATEIVSTALNVVSSWAKTGKAIGFLRSHFPSLLGTLCISLCLPSTGAVEAVATTLEISLEVQQYPPEQGHEESLAALCLAVGQSRTVWSTLLHSLFSSGTDHKDHCVKILHSIANICHIVCENQPDWVSHDDQSSPLRPRSTLKECILQLCSLPIRRVGSVANNAINVLHTVSENGDISSLRLVFREWFVITLQYLCYPCGFSKPNGWSESPPEKYLTRGFGVMQASVDQAEFHLYRYEASMLMENTFAALSADSFLSLLSDWAFKSGHACSHESSSQSVSWQRLEAALFTLKCISDPLTHVLISGGLSEDTMTKVMNVAYTVLDLKEHLLQIPAPLIRTACRWIKCFSTYVNVSLTHGNIGSSLFERCFYFCLQAMITPVGDDEDEEQEDENDDSDTRVIDDGSLQDGSMTCVAAANAIYSLIHRCSQNLQHYGGDFIGTILRKLFESMSSVSSLGLPVSVRIKLVESIAGLLLSSYKANLLSLDSVSSELDKLCKPGLDYLHTLCDRQHQATTDESILGEIDAQLRVLYAVFKFAKLEGAFVHDSEEQSHLKPLLGQCLPVVFKVMEFYGDQSQISNSCLGTLEQIISTTESLSKPHLQEILSLLLRHLESTGNFSAIETMATVAEAFASDSFGADRVDTSTADIFAQMTSRLQGLASGNSALLNDPDSACSYLTYLQRVVQYFPDVLLRDYNKLLLSFDHGLKCMLAGSQECSRRSCKLLNTLLGLPDKSWVSESMLSNYHSVIAFMGKSIIDTVVFALIDEQARTTMGTGKSSLPDILFRLISQAKVRAGKWVLEALNSQLQKEQQKLYNSSGNPALAGKAMGGISSGDLDMIVTYLLAAAGAVDDNSEIAQRGKKGGFGSFRMMIHDLSDIARGKNDREALLGYIV